MSSQATKNRVKNNISVVISQAIDETKIAVIDVTPVKEGLLVRTSDGDFVIKITAKKTKVDLAGELAEQEAKRKELEAIEAKKYANDEARARRSEEQKRGGRNFYA